MKKILSLALAALMAVSAFAVSVVPAMAAETVNSPSAVVIISPLTQVNGVANSADITFTQSLEDPYSVSFTYTGKGILEGWEYNLEELGFVDGTDYTASETEDGVLTINFISAASQDALEADQVIVNALVDMQGTTGTTDVTGTTEGTGSTGTTAGGTTADKNESSKSPATGLATSAVAGGIALAVAGLAVISAKKKDAE